MIAIMPCMMDWVQRLHVTTSCRSAISVHGSHRDSSKLSWCRHAFYWWCILISKCSMDCRLTVSRCPRFDLPGWWSGPSISQVFFWWYTCRAVLCCERSFLNNQWLTIFSNASNIWITVNWTWDLNLNPVGSRERRLQHGFCSLSLPLITGVFKWQMTSHLWSCWQ